MQKWLILQALPLSSAAGMLIETNIPISRPLVFKHVSIV